MNRVLIRPITKKTPYELWKSRKPKIGYFKVFGCKCHILNTKKNLGKFDTKTDEGIFLGYSTHSKAYRVYNKRTMIIEESVNIVFDEFDPYKVISSKDEEGIRLELENLEVDPKNESKGDLIKNLEEKSSEEVNRNWKYFKTHPQEQIIGSPQEGVRTRSRLKNISENLA